MSQKVKPGLCVSALACRHGTVRRGYVHGHWRWMSFRGADAVKEHSFFFRLNEPEIFSVLAAIQGLDPEFGHHILSAIHRSEDHILRKSQKGDLRERMRRRIPQFKAFENADPDEMVEAYLAFSSRCCLSAVYSLLYTNQLRDLIAFEGLDGLMAARQAGRNIVIVPFHARDYQSILGTIGALSFAVTAMSGTDPMLVPGW